MGNRKRCHEDPPRFEPLGWLVLLKTCRRLEVTRSWFFRHSCWKLQVLGCLLFVGWASFADFSGQHLPTGGHAYRIVQAHGHFAAAACACRLMISALSICSTAANSMHLSALRWVGALCRHRRRSLTLRRVCISHCQGAQRRFF